MEREREKQTEKHWLPLICALNKDRKLNLGMRPNQELNPQSLHGMTLQPIKPHWPGQEQF